MTDARTGFRRLVTLLCTQGLGARPEALALLRRMAEQAAGGATGGLDALVVELEGMNDFANVWPWQERLWQVLSALVHSRGPEPSTMAEGGPAPVIPPAEEADHVVRWVAPSLEAKVLADFFGEVGEHLEEASRIVVGVGGDDRETMQELYRKLHTVKGNCGMVGLAELQEVAHRLEDLVKRMRDAKRGPTEDERRVLADGMQLGLAVLDLAQSGKSGTVPLGRFRASVGRLLGDGGVQQGLGAGAAHVLPESAPVDAGRALDRPAGDSVPGAEAGPGPGNVAGPTPDVAAGHTPSGKAVRTATAGSKGAESHPVGLGRKTLRVDFGEVDRLALLVGEQSVRQEEALRQIARLEDRVEDVFRNLDAGAAGPESVRSAGQELGHMASDLEGTARSLDLVSGDIQRRVFDLRMVPLEALFERHRMTVFQAAASQGKQARLVIEAGDARIDKSIAEKLDEPMIHLLRNAVSHGIAVPADRVRAGKPPEGRVTVRAFSKGSQVVVEVEDDGVGIVPEVLRRKAVDKGFLSEEESRKVDDARVVDLIFAPGFSTTSRVDDVSGRGVGLDVVRNQVARVGGAVELASRPGQGTVFRLTLPLTLAVARVLMVQCAGEPVALPADSVMRVETVPTEALAEVAGRSMARIGPETLPFIRLGNLLELWDGMDLRAEYTVCIVRHGDRTGALAVDRVMEHTQAVVREAGALLPHVEHCMGVSVLEGRAVLIVDVGAVLRSWAEGTPRDGQEPEARVLMVGFSAERYQPLLRRLPRRPGPVLVAPSLLTPERARRAAVVAVAVDVPDLYGTLERISADGNRARVVVVAAGGPFPGLDRLYQLGVEELLDIDTGLERALESLLRSGGPR